MSVRLAGNETASDIEEFLNLNVEAVAKPNKRPVLVEQNIKDTASTAINDGNNKTPLKRKIPKSAETNKKARLANKENEEEN